MIFDDPNARFGETASLVQMLVFAIVIVAGLLTIHAWARLLRVGSSGPLIVFMAYVLIGLGLAAAAGPFAFATDGPVYDSQAMGVATDIGIVPGETQTEPLHPGKAGYPVLLGAIYAVTGRMPLAGILINCIFVGATVATILGAAQVAYGRARQIPVVVLFLVSPTFLTLGPAVMREALCWLGVSLLVFVSVQLWHRRLNGVSLFCLAGSISILVSVRTTLFVLMLLSVVIAFCIAIVWRQMGLTGLWFLLAFGALSLLVLGDPLIGILGFDFSSIMMTRDYLARSATTGFSISAGPLSAFGGAGLLLASLPTVVFGPFPWQMGPEPVWAWVALNAVSWWVAIILALRNQVARLRPGITVLLMSSAVGLLLGLSLTMTNFGIVARLRAIPLVIILVIVAGASKRKHVAMERRLQCA